MADKNKNRKLTRTDRSKIYKLKKQPNAVSKNTYIPKGLNSADRERRLDMIRSCVEAHEEFYCPAIGNKVAISKRTVDNFREKSALCEKSTRAALDIRNILQSATYILCDKPKKSKSQKNYINMHILICPIKGIGYVKVTIGEHSPTDKTNIASTPYALYSVLAISLHRLKS